MGTASAVPGYDCIGPAGLVRRAPMLFDTLSFHIGPKMCSELRIITSCFAIQKLIIQAEGTFEIKKNNLAGTTKVVP